jgi:hypothetical protein
MLKAPAFKSWLSGLGIFSAAGIFVGIFEPLGLQVAGAINALSYILWAIWLIATGVFLLRRDYAAVDASGIAH